MGGSINFESLIYFINFVNKFYDYRSLGKLRKKWCSG